MNLKITFNQLLTTTLTIGIVTGGVLMAGSTLLPTPAWAQKVEPSDLINLSLTPPNIYLAIQPGEASLQTLTLKNQSDQDLLVTPSLLSFGSDNQTGKAVLSQENNFKYLSFDDPDLNFDQQFFLPARSSKSIPVLIKLPDQIIEAEHHLTLLFTTQPQNYESTSNSTVGGAIASNMIILVSKNMKDRASLDIKKIDTWPMIDSLMPLQYQVLAENKGINSTTASGSATITDWQGKVVQEIEFQPDLVLANSSRYLRSDDNSVFKYKKPFLIGSYQISVNLMSNSSEDADQLTYTKTVLALPFSFLMLPLLVGLLYISYRVIITKTQGERWYPKKACY